MTRTVFLPGLFGLDSDFKNLKRADDIVINLQDFRNSISDMKTLAKEVLACLKKLPDQNFNICGYSLGGRLAIFLKLLDTIYFKKCVIISSKVFFKYEECLPRLYWYIFWSLNFLFLSKKKFFSLWYSQPLFSGYSYNYFLPRKLELDFNFQRKCFMNLSNILPMNPLKELNKVKKDFLFIYGGFDEAYKNHYQHLLSLGFFVKEIPLASHVVMIDQPKKTKNITRSFLDYF